MDMSQLERDVAHMKAKLEAQAKKVVIKAKEAVGVDPGMIPADVIALSDLDCMAAAYMDSVEPGWAAQYIGGSEDEIKALLQQGAALLRGASAVVSMQHGTLSGNDGGFDIHTYRGVLTPLMVLTAKH